MPKNNRSFRWALGIAVFTAAFLEWAIGALGVIAYEGFRGDMMYMAVLAVLVVGAAVARFRARGMAPALFATATRAARADAERWAQYFSTVMRGTSRHAFNSGHRVRGRKVRQ
jgi:hypothetical protein